MRLAAGTRQPSKRSRASGCGAITSMRSAISRPGVSASTMKARDAARAGARRCAGAREDDVEVGDAAVGDPGLLAVEHVVVAVGARARRPSRRRRSRRRARTARRRRSPRRARRAAASAPSAPRVPASAIAPEPRPCIAKAKSARPSWRASVSRIRQIARVSIASPAPPCAVPATACAQPAAVAERAHQRAAGGVDVARRADAPADVRRGPGVELGREGAVARLEERPVEVVGRSARRVDAGALSCPRTPACCFAAKAS